MSNTETILLLKTQLALFDVKSFLENIENKVLQCATIIIVV